MATTEWGPERLKAYYADLAADNDAKIRVSVYTALQRAEGERNDLVAQKGKLTQDFQIKAAKVLGDYQKAKASGQAAAKTRAQVEMARLVLLAPTDFSKAATSPDKAWLLQLQQRLPQGASATEQRERQRMAWEAFYNDVEPTAANVLGTYMAMLKNYGDADGKEPEGLVTPDKAFLWQRKQNMEAKLRTEQVNAQEFDDRYKVLVNEGQAFDEFVKTIGAQPLPDGTYDPSVYVAFQDNYGLKDRLPSLEDTSFMAGLQKKFNDPAAYDGELFRKDISAGIEQADKDIAEWKDRIPKAPGETDVSTEDTFRDKLAAWVQKPQVQWWAEKRGFKLGESFPLTPELQKEIDDGKYPGSVYTKYGVYIPSPDDMKAFHAADRDLKRRPEEGLFRAAGLAQGPNRMVEVTLKAAPDARIASIGVAGTGAEAKLVGKRANGQWVVSDDEGETWVPVDEAQGAALAQGVEMKPPDVDPEGAVAEPQARTVRGVYRAPVYGRDKQGSVRYVDPETNQEVYVAPDEVQAHRFLDAEPDPTTPSEIARGLAEKGAERRMENKPAPQPEGAPAPKVSTGKDPAKPSTAALPKVVVPEAPKATPVAEPDPVVEPEPKGTMLTGDPVLDAPPMGTTTQPTTTPSASTDPRREMFRRARLPAAV